MHEAYQPTWLNLIEHIVPCLLKVYEHDKRENYCGHFTMKLVIE